MAQQLMQLLTLRLAVILSHARRDLDLQGLRLTWDGEREARLTCRTDWVQRYPQSAHLLQEEVPAWQKTAWTLHVLNAG